MSTTIQKQLLINLDNLFSDPEKWIRNYLHNDTHTAWCLLGGMDKVSKAIGIGMYSDPYNKAWGRIDEIAAERSRAPEYQSGGFCPIAATSYNNHPSTSFEDIKSLIAEAIQTVDA